MAACGPIDRRTSDGGRARIGNYADGAARSEDGAVDLRSFRSCCVTAKCHRALSDRAVIAAIPETGHNLRHLNGASGYGPRQLGGAGPDGEACTTSYGDGDRDCRMPARPDTRGQRLW